MSDTERYLPAEQRRERTVAAVIELAAEQDPAAITTAAIANRMQLTQGALFRHFPSKEAIWEAAMEWVARRLLERIERAAQGQPAPLAALEAMFLAHASFVAAHPGVPRMMFGELQRAGDTPAKRLARTLIAQYGVRLHRLIEDGKSRGELCPGLDAEGAATLFIGSLQGLVMQSLIAGDVARVATEAPRVFALYRRAVEARP